jgi:hypothetical protein
MLDSPGLMPSASYAVPSKACIQKQSKKCHVLLFLFVSFCFFLFLFVSFCFFLFLFVQVFPLASDYPTIPAIPSFSWSRGIVARLPG